MVVGIYLGTAACSTTTTSNGTSAYINNSALTAKVKTALFNAHGLSSRHISVNSNNGAVALSGSVPSYAQSSLAQQTAAKVNGVSSVENNLVIDPDY